MTVGKLPTVIEMDKAFEALLHINDIFETTVNTISVEWIGEKEESNIEIEYTLKSK